MLETIMGCCLPGERGGVNMNGTIVFDPHMPKRSPFDERMNGDCRPNNIVILTLYFGLGDSIFAGCRPYSLRPGTFPERAFLTTGPETTLLGG